MKTKQLRIVLITLLLNSFFTTSFAQAPNWQWAQSAYGTEPDYGKGIATDVSGNVYVTGTFLSPTITFGTVTLTGGNFDMYLVKYDPSGNVLWARSTGGSGIVSTYKVATDPSGNVVVTGIFQGATVTFGNTTLTNDSIGKDEIFIVKYNASGNVLWAKAAHGNYTDRAYGIATDLMGNIIITGEFQSTTITFDSITLTNAGPFTFGDMFVAKYDFAGNVLWAKKAGGLGDDAASRVATDASGNILVTGIFISPTITFGSTTLINLGDADIFTVKYDAAGNVLWTKSAGGINMDGAYSSITVDGNGNILISGSFLSPTLTFGSTTLVNSGTSNDDMYLTKYDAAGNVLWAKSVGGTNSEGSFSVTTDGSNNVIVVGFFYGQTITFGTTILIQTGTGYDDSFIVKYDPLGNVIWAKSFGGSDFDEVIDVATDGTGNMFVTGDFFSNTINFGTTTLTNATNMNPGDPDMFVAKLNSTTGLAENFNSNNTSIYPNPTTNTFTIKNLTAGGNTLLQIVNVIGEVVYSEKLSGNQEHVIKPNLPAGIYSIKLTEAEKQYMQKLIIQ